MLKLNIDCKATTINLIGHNCYCIKAGLPLRESFSRQVGKKSRGPQGEGSGILKEEKRTNFFFSSTFLRIMYPA